MRDPALCLLLGHAALLPPIGLPPAGLPRRSTRAAPARTAPSRISCASDSSVDAPTANAWTVRVARPSERSAVASLRVEVFTPELTSPYHRHQQARVFEETMAGKITLVALRARAPEVARVGPPVVIGGSADLVIVPEVGLEGSPAAYVTNVCVRPQIQRAGIGSLLMREAEVRRDMRRDVCAEVSRSNPTSRVRDERPTQCARGREWMR